MRRFRKMIRTSGLCSSGLTNRSTFGLGKRGSKTRGLVEVTQLHGMDILISSTNISFSLFRPCQCNQSGCCGGVTWSSRAEKHLGREGMILQCLGLLQPRGASKKKPTQRGLIPQMTRWLGSGLLKKERSIFGKFVVSKRSNKFSHPREFTKNRLRMQRSFRFSLRGNIGSTWTH